MFNCECCNQLNTAAECHIPLNESYSQIFPVFTPKTGLEPPLYKYSRVRDQNGWTLFMRL